MRLSSWKKAAASAAAFCMSLAGWLAAGSLGGLSACSPAPPTLTLRGAGELRFAKPPGFYPAHAGCLAYYGDSVGQRDYYYFLDRQRNLLYCAAAAGRPDSLPLRAVSLQHLFHATTSPIEALGVISPDSLVFVDGGLRDVCLTDGQGAVRRQWRPRAPIYGRTDYLIDTYLQPVHSWRGQLYLQSMPDLGMIIADSARFNRYLTFRPGLVLSVRDTTQASSRGAFPPALSAAHNFNVLGPVTCVSPEGHYLLSYGPFSEVYDYAPDGTCRVVAAPSRYHRPAAGQPFAALTNRQALIDYKLTQPEYTRLLSDPYRRGYLRVYLHGLPLDTTAAFRPAYADMPWSLVLLDARLRPVGEVPFTADFDPRSILVTRQGILVGHNRPERPGYQARELRYRLFTYASLKQP